MSELDERLRLVEELGEIVADMLLEESGVLTRSAGFCVATSRVAAAVLDRLAELGRLEPIAPKPGALLQPALGQKCLCGRPAYAWCAECGEMTADCTCDPLQVA